MRTEGIQLDTKSFAQLFNQAPKKLTASEKKKQNAILEAEEKKQERSNSWARKRKLEEEAEAAKTRLTKEEEGRKLIRHKQLSKIDKHLAKWESLEESRVWQRHSIRCKTQKPYLSEEKYQFLKRITSTDHDTTMGRNQFCQHLNDLCANDLLATFELIAYREWDQYKHKTNEFDV
jgi:Fe2+ transport system protein B